MKHNAKKLLILTSYFKDESYGLPGPATDLYRIFEMADDLSIQLSQKINQTISMYQPALDILPNHSTPFVIHHASGLGNGIRQIELIENIEFKRHGPTIAWWQTNDQGLL